MKPAPTSSPKKEKPTTLRIQMEAASGSENATKSKATQPTAMINSSKTLKRCLSVPIMHSVPAAATAANDNLLETPKKDQQAQVNNGNGANSAAFVFLGSAHIGIPRSNPSSRCVFSLQPLCR